MEPLQTLNYILTKLQDRLVLNLPTPFEVPDFTREDLAKLFAELKFKIGVEVGVEQGDYSVTLLKHNPLLKLCMIDPWKSFKGNMLRTNKGIIPSEQWIIDKFYENTCKKVEGYHTEIIRESSMKAVQDFANKSLDFVYIDGNHNFEFVINDIIQWSKRVRVGGIISGHDYIEMDKPCTCHVKEAVDAYTTAYDIRPWFVLGRQYERENESKDSHRSWMWIKKGE